MHIFTRGYNSVQECEVISLLVIGDVAGGEVEGSW